MKFPQVLNPLRRTRFAWLFPFTWTLLTCAAVIAPITLEVFLHHHFGARTGKSLLKGFILLLVVAPLFELALPPAPVPLFAGFIFAYAVVAVSQWINARFGSHNEHIHSYRHGEPWPLWRRAPWSMSTIQRFLEPALGFSVAWIVSIFDSPLAHWLFIATAALFVKQQVRRAQLRTHHMDALDGRIETTERAPRLRTENEGFVEARPAPTRRTARER
jgi:hypothetical protein